MEMEMPIGNWQTAGRKIFFLITWFQLFKAKKLRGWGETSNPLCCSQGRRPQEHTCLTPAMFRAFPCSSLLVTRFDRICIRTEVGNWRTSQADRHSLGDVNNPSFSSRLHLCSIPLAGLILSTDKSALLFSCRKTPTIPSFSHQQGNQNDTAVSNSYSPLQAPFLGFPDVPGWRPYPSDLVTFPQKHPHSHKVRLCNGNMGFS